MRLSGAEIVTDYLAQEAILRRIGANLEREIRYHIQDQIRKIREKIKSVASA